jgi:hypothetical protein
MNLRIHQNLMESSFKHKFSGVPDPHHFGFWFISLEWSPRICISNNFPGSADAAGSGSLF